MSIERSKAKALRQMPAPEEVKRSRGKKKKPFVVEYRYIGACEFLNKEWRKYKAYTSLDVAEAVTIEQQRKLGHLWEFRLKEAL